MLLRPDTSGSTAEWAGWSLMAIIALAPLLFGATIPLAWGINAVLVGALTAAVLIWHALQRRPLPVPLERFDATLSCLLAVAVWMALQASTLTPSVLHHPAWGKAVATLGGETITGGAISANPGETAEGLLRFLTALACGWLALQLCRDPIWARRLLWTVAISGAAYALYGVSERAMSSQHIFWVERPFRQVATGTYINPNSFAIHIGIAILAALALLMRDLRRSLAGFGLRDMRETLATGVAVGRDIGVHAVVLLPLVLALVLSGSRAGFLLTVLLIFALLAIQRRRDGAQSNLLGIAVMVVAAGGGLALLLHGAMMTEELGGTRADTFNSRLEVAAIMLRAVADRPLLGHGYGTFADVFPGYRDAGLALSGTWLEAHNAYLEGFVGLGIPAAVLLLTGLLFAVAACLRGALQRRRDHWAALVAVLATLMIGLHALIDFSIQIPSIALTYSALLGAGLAQSWSRRTAASGSRSGEAELARLDNAPASMQRAAE